MRQETTRDLPWWIVGRAQDLTLVIATPLLIVPLLVVLGEQSSVQALLLAVALGHHLPGMVRAYGDRDLFERFRARFIFAPLLLVPLSVALTVNDLEALSVVVVVWGTWHGLAQTYGFARIYDAKRGEGAATTRHLDLALCIGWFGAGFLLSPERLGGLLNQYYESGGALLPPDAVRGFQEAWFAATLLATLAFLVNLGLEWRRGHTPNLPKLALLVSSCGFWWYAMVGIEDAILGVAWFELFHDVQYLAIVWAFNRRVVDKGGRVGPLTRLLFRRSGAMVALYTALVVAYGALNPIDLMFASGTLHHVLAGVIAASSLLHFYYDGFIWKLRDRSIKAGLDLEGGSLSQRETLPDSLRHAAAWGLLALLVVLFSASQLLRPTPPELARFQNLAAIVPDEPANLLQLGDALHARRHFDEAIARYQRVSELRPESALAHAARGRLLAHEGELRPAIAAFRSALRMNPQDVSTRISLGIAFFRLGDLPLSRTAFAEALEIEPGNYAAVVNLGAVCERQGDLPCARGHYEQALAIDAQGGVAREALERVQSRERDRAGGS